MQQRGKKNIISTRSIITAIVMSFFIAGPLLAQTMAPPGTINPFTGKPVPQPSTEGEGIQSGPSTVGSGGDDLNPLGETDPRVIVGRVINAILGIVGSLALLAFIGGGLMWVTAAGNDDKIKKGKDMIIWATFGLIIIFLAYIIINFLIASLVPSETG